MPDAATVADRKERNVCTACGTRAPRKNPPAVKCQECITAASSQKLADQRRNPSKYAEAERQRRQTRKRFGLCLRCDEPALEGKAKCAVHLAETRESVRRAKKSAG